MFGAKKERFYLHEILENPIITYPTYYNVNKALHENEMFHDALIAVHMCDFKHYELADEGSDIFASINRGAFVIYKEQYIVGFFGGKLMYLEPSGWKGLPATEEVFNMENWLV